MEQYFIIKRIGFNGGLIKHYYKSIEGFSKGLKKYSAELFEIEAKVGYTDGIKFDD